MNVDKIIDEIVSSKQIWYSTGRFGGKILDVRSDAPVLDVKLKVVKPIVEGNMEIAGVDWLSINNPDVDDIQNLLNDGYIILYISNSTDKLLWCHSCNGIISRGTVLLGNNEKSSFTLDEFWLATEEFIKTYAYVMPIKPSLLLAPALLCAIEMIDNGTFALRDIEESALRCPNHRFSEYVKYITCVIFAISRLTKENQVEHIYEPTVDRIFTLSSFNDPFRVAYLANNCEHLWTKYITSECEDSIRQYIVKFVSNNS